jgi:arylsulfatase
LTHHGWFGERNSKQADDEHVGAHAATAAVNESGDKAVTDVLPAEAITLAEVLRGQGYRTAAFVANPWIRPEWGFAQGFEVFETFQEASAQQPIVAATKWLEQLGDQPSFVFLHLMDVHGPYQAPEDDYRALADSSGLAHARSLDDKDFARIPEYLRQPRWAKEPAARDLKTWRTRYAAGVRSLDRSIGALVQYLSLASKLESTVLMVTADHGEELLEHDSWDHGRNLFDHQTHVPWIVRLPDKSRAGARVTSVVSLADVMPTAISYLGGKTPAMAQGQDRSELLESDDPSSASIAEGIKWRPQVFSVRTAGYKLVADLKREKYALYHLLTDPGEQRDVAGREPETVRVLLELLLLHIEETSRDALRGGQVELSEELQEQLKELGYGV